MVEDAEAFATRIVTSLGNYYEDEAINILTREIQARDLEVRTPKQGMLGLNGVACTKTTHEANKLRAWSSNGDLAEAKRAALAWVNKQRKKERRHGV